MTSFIQKKHYIKDNEGAILLSRSYSALRISAKLSKPAETKAQGGRLTSLLKLSEQACHILAGFVQDVYRKMHDASLKKTKADNSFFSIADGLVQHAVKELFPPDKFLEFVGEEDVEVNVTKRPYTVDDLKLPNDLADSFDKAHAKLERILPQISSSAYKDLSVFVDPIDGTREFCNGKGQQCSICIGFCKDGAPVAGIVFRPIPFESGQTTFMAGCKSEGYVHGRLNEVKPEESSVSLLSSNGSISQYIAKFIEVTPLKRVKSGGCGNKMLMLLENKGSCYIQDRGVSRWDTCAAQAVLEAKGGMLVKLTSVLENSGQKATSYSYRKGTCNTDLNEKATLTKYNTRRKSELPSDSKQVTVTKETVNAYSNLCGLYAVLNHDQKLHALLSEGLRKALKTVEPSYN